MPRHELDCTWFTVGEDEGGSFFPFRDLNFAAKCSSPPSQPLYSIVHRSKLQYSTCLPYPSAPPVPPPLSPPCIVNRTCKQSSWPIEILLYSTSTVHVHVQLLGQSTAYASNSSGDPAPPSISIKAPPEDETTLAISSAFQHGRRHSFLGMYVCVSHASHSLRLQSEAVLLLLLLLLL